VAERPDASSLEAEIAQLRARVDALEHEKADLETFSAVAAHELLTPVVMMDACAAMVADRLDEALHRESHEDLDNMRRSAARTRLLVETLLHHARSQGRAPLRGHVPVDRVLRECLTLLRPEIRARHTAVHVEPLPEVLAEEPLLGSLFGNLLANALKYGPRERGTVTVGGAAESGGWRFCVDSEGRPIAVEQREAIFEPYRRGPGERRAHGAGLGLAICRYIVERHGGRIGVAAAPAGGNRFWFTLPA
jgi:signal transduction histidine kinase